MPTAPPVVPIPSELRGQHRLVVRSIGRASAGIIGALKQVIPLQERDLASLLYRAPAVLLTGVAPEAADNARKILESAGLDCAVEPVADPFQAGDADHDVALVAHDVARLPEIVREVALFLGLPVARAQKIVCAAPAVLVGGVSAATVEAIRQRFAPLGAEIDVSRPAEAVFDLFIEPGAPTVRRAIEALIAKAIEPAPSCPVAGPIVVSELNRGVATDLWERLQRTSAAIRTVNRDFARYDIRLDSASDSDELRRIIVDRAGVPAAVVPRVLAGLPIVIAQNVRYSEMEALLTTLLSAGATATALPVFFQTFDLEVTKVGDRRLSEELLSGLGGLPPARATAVLTPRGRIDGKLTKLTALWLHEHLRRVGTETQLVTR